MIRTLHIISYATLITTFSFMFAMGLMVGYDRFNPPAVIKTIYHDATGKKGSSILVLNEINRIRSCRAITNRELINIPNMKVYETETVDRDVQKSEKLITREVKVDIPIYIPTGEYSYRAVINYYCNISNYFLGPITIVTDAIRFNVTD
ncbi:MAG: hypothetical protein K2P52_02535 [Campylobacterales bacterium]|nr:hypothetical protein [Campylobacterales bacterium]